MTRSHSLGDGAQVGATKGGSGMTPSMIPDRKGFKRPGRKPIPVIDRIRARVIIDVETGCHNWTGYVTPSGYGQIKPDGKNRSGSTSKRVHRIAYELAKGPIPPDLVIDHLCGNRACCNPDHLAAVTQCENVRRAPTHNANRTHCPQGHPYDRRNTYIGRRGDRHCRVCLSARDKRAREIRRALRAASAGSEPSARVRS